MKFKASIVLLPAFLLFFSACRKDSSVPEISTLTVQNLSYYSANCGGMVTNDGGSEVTLRGVCWSTQPSPTINDDTTVNTGDQHHFISELPGLTPSTTYFVRAYAINSIGTGYGKVVEFSTLKGTVPELLTHQVSQVYSMQADVEGEVISDGDLAITERGICWGTGPFPSINSDKIAAPGSSTRFTATIKGLLPTTTYYARTYAINQAGVGYGEPLEFTTPETEPLPEVLTKPAQKITQWSAVGVGEIINEGSLPISERGVCWGTSPNPERTINFKVDLTGSDLFSVKIDYLKPVATYYIRAYVISITGIIYGNQQIFSTIAIGAACPESPAVSDIDGNVYQTVQVGDICIFKENLKTTKFSNGDLITYSDAFINQPSYTWYAKNLENKHKYGGLYNWYAVSSENGLCPEGWHITDNHEWNSIAAFAGFVAIQMNVPDGTSVLKSTLTEPDPHPRWNAGGVPTNDLLGFSALPGGARFSASWSYNWLGSSAYFWLSDDVNENSALARNISNYWIQIFSTGGYKTYFMSVRCVKD
ncbi:MAG: fibrobacter succinogenes major paralogous domain-containing protein [Bacteroidales bacterium]|nr:fibrobacter succinogenes major paralogous domain-containing protein [Bacteroidales bacterium]